MKDWFRQSDWQLSSCFSPFTVKTEPDKVNRVNVKYLVATDTVPAFKTNNIYLKNWIRDWDSSERGSKDCDSEMKVVVLIVDIQVELREADWPEYEEHWDSDRQAESGSLQYFVHYFQEVKVSRGGTTWCLAFLKE